MQATPFEVEENLSLAEGLIIPAGQDGAQLVVLPEMFNVGYYLGEEVMTGRKLTWFQQPVFRCLVSHRRKER
jgi:predicted amidohydrolase